MSEFPSMPLFTDAFLADTGHLTAHETGAYMLLLMMAWRMPDGRLPDDDAKLCRWARVDPKQWHFTKRRVMEFWTYHTEESTEKPSGLDAKEPRNNLQKPTGLCDPNEIKGFWSQKRLSLELERVRRFAERSRANGRLGGRPKPLKTNGTGNPLGSCRVTQTKAPNPIKKEKEKEILNGKGRIFIERDTPEWAAWQQVKRIEGVYSREHKANGWWFETKWPTGAERLSA